MPFPLFQVDAFADAPFRGNPAAVCLPGAAALSDGQMQRIAQEMNCSETAFLRPRAAGEAAAGAFDLRWFTPAQEVDLCGHATLAAAHVLWETGRAPAEAPLTFHTRSGPLAAHPPMQRGPGTWITLDFPAEPVAPCTAPAGLSAALGLDAPPLFIGRNRMDLLVQLTGEAAVRRLAPDLARLAAIEARGVIVTAPAEDAPAEHDAESGCDFVSRFFAPKVGVPEDPVTGSAHCALAPFWAERLGRARLTGYQASARGGTVRVEVREEGARGNEARGRVRLGGQAVTVVRGALRV